MSIKISASDMFYVKLKINIIIKKRHSVKVEQETTEIFLKD